ncbi:MAG TPA: hypothetical protein VII94_04890 [Candidatus Saccharimonadales bacterium]
MKYTIDQLLSLSSNYELTAVKALTKETSPNYRKQSYVYVSDNLLSKYGQTQPAIEIDDPPMLELDPPVAAKPKPRPLSPKAQLANKVKNWLLANKRPNNQFIVSGPHGERYLTVNEYVGHNGELGPQTTNALKNLQHDIAFRNPAMPNPFVKQDGTLNDPTTVKSILEYIQ